MTRPDLGETDKFKAMLNKSGYMSRRNGNAPYLVAVVVSLLIAVVGSAFIISLRPDYDPIIIILTITGVTTALTTQLLQFMKLNEVAQKAEIAAVQSKETQIQTSETHNMVNSQLSSAIETARKAGYGAGMQAGEDKANQRTDELKAAQTSNSMPGGRRVDDPPTTEVSAGTRIKGTIEGTIEETKEE